MTALGPDGQPPASSSRKGVVIAAIIAGAVILGGLVWWLTSQDDAPEPTPSPSVSPSVTPSPSPSPSPSVTPTPSPTETATEPSLADIDGRWCSTSPDDPPDTCVTVTLPQIVWDGHEDQPQIVYPPGAEPDAPPETLDYSVPPNSGGCWLGGIDSYPAASGAPFMYCPAGADGGADEFGDFTGMSGPADQDRMWPGFQESTDAPYLRAEN